MLDFQQENIQVSKVCYLYIMDILNRAGMSYVWQS